MKVLVGCEFSGIVREAFRTYGHDAYSCDLLESEQPGPHHLIGDVRQYLYLDWDLGIFFPPCTHLAASGARWWKDKLVEQQLALNFVRELLGAPIARIALENPVGLIGTRLRKPDQIIQPWQFGDNETKTTCLWLKNLPYLVATDVVSSQPAKAHNAKPTDDRWMERSRTYPGFAAAMAEQWGSLSMEAVA